jgi:hemolysin activation/secretion protein
MPVQGRFYLGGPATLRGYSGAIVAGEAFWRGRVEVANSFPGVRLAAFSDIGWAGSRSDFRRGKPLLSTGIGASLLDGLIRLDLARGTAGPEGLAVRPLFRRTPLGT